MPKSSKFVLAFVGAAALAAMLGLCCSAAEEKKEPPADKELESLVKDLRSKDIGTRLKTIKKLADKGEDGAPAARALCDAIADISPRIRTAALEAVEKVRPDLYRALAKMVLDDKDYNRTAAVEELGQMGEKASPCLGLILAKLRTELPRRGVSDSVAACFKAIKQIGPDAEAIKFFKLVAGSRDTYGRFAAIRALDEWTEGDEAKRKEIFPLVLRALEDDYCRIYCMRLLGSYGALAKDAVPQLKKFKLSSNETIRNAATAAIDEIESQSESKEERPKKK